VTYAAFLRAINLGARNRIRMADLRSLVEELGYEGVRTYLQTGNVAFEGTRAKPEAVAARLERALAGVGLGVDVMVRTRAQLQALVRAEPLAGYDERSYSRYVIFTKTAVAPPGEPLEIKGVTFVPSPRAALVAVSPKDGTRSSYPNAIAEARWKVRATTRWWNVVEDFTRDVVTSRA
jgi:uncharacterized protein (DUF1697 family)